MASYETVLVHTADNIPPFTLALDATNITGASAVLSIALDEPGTAFYSVVRAAAGGADSTPCLAAGDLFGQGPAAVGAHAGSFPVRARSPQRGSQMVRNLTSETLYVACVVARDATTMENRQTVVRKVAFTTLDITPPAVAVALAPGQDGDVTCVRSQPYTCSATWTITLSEAGALRWALVTANSLRGALPNPAGVLAAPTPGVALPNATVLAAGDATFAAAGASSPISVVVPSKVSYRLVVAARDAAAAPNVAAPVTVVGISAPDVQPPVFINYSTSAASDTSLTFSLQLDEDSVTHYVLTVNPSAAPSVAQVLAGSCANGSAAHVNSSVATPGNTSTPLLIGRLPPGTLFDLHMVAVDAVGNTQAAVTTIRWGLLRGVAKGCAYLNAALHLASSEYGLHTCPPAPARQLRSAKHSPLTTTRPALLHAAEACAPQTPRPQ